MQHRSKLFLIVLAGVLGCLAVWLLTLRSSSRLLAEPEVQAVTAVFAKGDVRESAAPTATSGAQETEAAWTNEWPQWGGTSARNNTPNATGLPTEWDIGGFDRRTGEWLKENARGIKWVAQVGSQTYGNPVVADGKVFVGTNNGAGYLARYPDEVDLGCLLAFAESDGRFLWQHSSEKLPTGRVHDWPLQGICCAPLVEGKRLWFVTSRGETVCVDTEGFYDNEDDGPVIGQWGGLANESLAIHEGLDDGNVSAALRGLLEQEGVASQGRLAVQVESQGQAWQLTLRDREGKSHYYRIRLADGKLLAHQIAAADDQAEGRLLFRVDPQLVAGLDDGSIGPALRAVLAERGMQLPPETQVTAEVAGAKWSWSGSIEGSPRALRISKAGRFLQVFKLITPDDKDEADTVWSCDMMKELGVSQHNMCSCSVTALGDILFVNTSNGVDESHINIPAPAAPSFVAMDKNSGKVLWTDKSPGLNILHGQWSSPSVGTFAGVPQVLFAAGDGWVYSFRADAGRDGKPELLWKFDANPKESKYIVSGLSTRNHIIGTPVIYDDLIYVGVGEDPEHGEGVGHLWCIDPTKRGDVSPQLAMKIDGGKRVPMPHRRLQAVIPEEGEVAVDNPNSAVVWHYSQFDQNGDGQFDFNEVMHRTLSTVAIKNGLLYVADFSGLVHCLDAKTGKVHWTYDMLAAIWGSALIADGKVYVGDEDGDLCVFRLSSQAHEPVAEINMDNSVYSTPVVAKNVLYISNKTHLFAIQDENK